MLGKGLYRLQGNRGARRGPVHHEAKRLMSLLGHLHDDTHGSQVMRTGAGRDQHQVGDEDRGANGLEQGGGRVDDDQVDTLLS